MPRVEMPRSPTSQHVPATTQTSSPDSSVSVATANVTNARASTIGDELIAARIDLDQRQPARKRWNFLGRRQPQHYAVLLQPVTDKETHR